MGLLIAAGFTTALALGAFVFLLVRAESWRPAALAFVIALPMSPLAYYAVRMPIDGALKASFGLATWVFIVSMFYAPLTEEPAKWLAAAVPMVRRAIHSQPVTMALAVGLGFGIGEIWFLAHLLVSQPGYPDLPPWMFNGFVIERLEVCFLHGAFVALPFAAFARGRSFWLGGLAGMVLHFFLNFPILLAKLDVFGLGSAWVSVLLLWVVGFVVACAAMTCRLARRSSTKR
jgi:hypothetical protein